MPGFLPIPGVKTDKRQLWLSKTTQALDRPDFTGFEVYADSLIAMAQPMFACPQGGAVLRVGELAPADVTLLAPTFDGASMSASMAAAFMLLPMSSLTVKGGRFDNAQRLHFKSWGEALTLEKVFVGKYGLGATKDSHNEAVFINGGRFTVRGCQIDSRGTPGPDRIGHTAQMYFEAEVAPIHVVIDGGTMVGAKHLGLLFPIQARARNFDVTITVRNFACQAGSAPRWVGPTQEKGKVRVIDGGGNTDVDTGRTVDWTWPK
jgi:hypothetical protein